MPALTALPTPDALHPLDLALGAAALVCALAAVLGRTRRAATTAFLTLGVVLALVWLRLGSVDVALAEAGLGTAVLAAVLVWVAVRTPEPDGAAPAPTGRAGRAALAAVTGAVAVLGIAALWTRAEQAAPAWSGPLATRLPENGVEHGVTAVLLGFRAYDTLLESAVLMLAGLAALAIGTSGGPGLTAVPPRITGMPATALRVLAPALLLLGLWLVFAGSSGPGGAFQSGAVFAGLLVLLHLSGVRVPGLRRLLAPALVVGVLVFLAAAVPGVAGSPAWLDWSAGPTFALVLTVELSLTLGITAGLYALFLAFEEDPHA